MVAIETLADGPASIAALHRAAGAPPRTTMRAYLRSLTEAGVVQRAEEGEFDGGSGYQLTAAGSDLIAVSEVLGKWLGRAPHGGIELGSTEAKNAIRALVDGWTAGMLRAFAARPLSLTELDGVIVALSYPSLERRLAALRLLGMVEAVPSEGRSTPYTATKWLRMAIAPLAAATGWERVHRAGEAPPATNRDVEAAFMLTLPIVRVAETMSGGCRLTVSSGNGQAGSLVGVTAEVRAGVVVSCVTGLEGSPDAWASGPLGAWITAVLTRDLGGLEQGGRPPLAAALVEGIHGVLSPG